MIAVVIFIVIGYLIGSLSSAIIVCKFMNLPDPRTEGSKNPGATNVLRIGGKLPAILTLVGDVFKGVLPVLVARIFGLNGFELALVALAAFCGHLLPIFFRFQGGKGVATFFGTIFVLSPTVGAVSLITWLIVAAVFRYSSLASLVTALLSPICFIIFSDSTYLAPVIIMIALIVWKHWGNIQRLLNGTESKIKLSSSF